MMAFSSFSTCPSVTVDVSPLSEGKSKEEISTRSYRLESPQTPKVDELASSLTVTDQDDDYLIVHWTECSDSSPDLIKSCRGVIHKGDEIVCKTFNYTPEFIGASDDALAALTAIWDQPKIIYPAFEGTNVRLWFDNGKWHLSTFRKLDASRSRWGSATSYGELFTQGLVEIMKAGFTKMRICHMASVENLSEQEWLDIYYASLCVDRIYTFLIHSIATNRIVSKITSNIPRISFTGEFSRDSFILLRENTSHIDWPSSLFTKLFFMHPANIEDHLKFVENADPDDCQGLMIHYGVGSSSFGSIKITSKRYQGLAELRGNEPSVVCRYLQLRNDMMVLDDAKNATDKKQKFESFKGLYSERQQEFNEYEQIISDAARVIYDGYVRRYINKEYVNLPQELWFIMRDLHDAYLQNPEKNKISMKLVQNHMNHLPSVRMNFIVRQAKLRGT